MRKAQTSIPNDRRQAISLSISTFVFTAINLFFMWFFHSKIMLLLTGIFSIIMLVEGVRGIIALFKAGLDQDGRFFYFVFLLASVAAIIALGTPTSIKLFGP